MALVLDGTGTITGLSAGGLTDASITAADLASTLDLTGKTVTLPAGVGGKILQIQTGIATTQVESSFSSETSLGLSVSITPSSTSSKILIFVQCAGCGARGSTYWKITLRKNSSALINFASYVGINSTSEETYPNTVYLDSPSTTSAITYDISGTRIGGTNNCFFNHNAGSPDNCISTICAMEIAG